MISFEDSPQKNFNKSKFCYKVTFYLFIGLMLFTQLNRVLKINGIISALLISLSVVAMFAFVPCGLFFVIKSLVKKEPFHRYRILYLIGHLFFLLLLVILLISIGRDIAKFR